MRNLRKTRIQRFKVVVAVLLLPVCYGAIKALGRVIVASERADAFWIVLMGGMACWLAVYLLLPKPMLIYVFGHELTHVLWTWLFGGRVKKFKVSRRGGHVHVTKSNFLIALAPYFFPIYVIAVVGVFVLGNWLWDWQAQVVWFHWLVGVAYGFHLTLTWHILKTSQTDLTSHGILFSGVIILLGNLTVLLLGLPGLTARVSVPMALGWWMQETGGLLQSLGDMFAR